MNKEFTREDGQVIVLVAQKSSGQRAHNSRKVASVSETVFKQHLLLVDKAFI